MQPETLNAAGVAELLGIGEDYFRSIRKKLEDNGFPRKLPGLSKWSKPAVRRWIRTNGETFLPAEPKPTIDGVASLAGLSFQLEKDYAA